MADEAEVTRASHPLHDMVLCCTSVEINLRNSIQRKCEEMGARHLLDLTSECTHLICGELFTPKYRYVAKMRPDVKVMRTGWLEAMYEDWIKGEDIDPQVFEGYYRFPVFYGLRISVTGIVDVEERRRVGELCLAESATYNPDLTRDVTHLVAVAPTGKKYQFARKHKIPVVLPEWLKDSMERGMALDEDCYNPLLPREKIGVGARPAKAAVQTEVQHFNGKRKIRKATQEKLGGLSQGLWEDIVGQARNIKPAKRNEWEEADVMSDGDEMGQARNVKPTKSHELEVYDMLSPENDVVSPGDCMELHREADKGSEEEGNENNGTGRMDPTIDVASQGPPPPKKAPPPPPKKGGMFANCGFWMWGFGDKQMAALKDAVVPHDGTVLGSLDDLEGASYLSWRLVVVPREKRLAEYPYIPEDYEVTVVTEWWLETCLHHQKFVMPMGDFTTMPIEEFEVDEMKSLDICITKFIGIDLLYYPRLIKLLGATFHEVLTKNRSLLITNDSRASGSEKIKYAHEHNIPVVTGEWLVECLKQHRKLSYEAYQILPAGPNEYRSLIGDKFKRKPDAEPFATNKRAHIETSEGRDELAGCTLYISQQLKDRSTEITALAQELGAVVLDEFNESLTHLVHRKFTPTADPDYTRAAAIPGCKIVSPRWLDACKSACRRVDEASYPPPMRASTTNLPSPKAMGPPPFTDITQILSRLDKPLPTGPPTGPPTTPPFTDITQILSRLGKTLPTAPPTAPSSRPPLPRGKLQGKAPAGKPRVFSRTPSGASSERAAMEDAAADDDVNEPEQSQALAYNYEETSMEKRRVRAKLDGDGVVGVVGVEVEGGVGGEEVKGGVGGEEVKGGVGGEEVQEVKKKKGKAARTNAPVVLRRSSRRVF